MSHHSNYLVVLAGGSGTRLWPLSRKNFPKQFLKVASTESLLRETVIRLKDQVPLQNVLIVCGKDHADLMKKEFPEFSPEQFILEPCGRNTAPAIALASLLLLRKDPEAVMVVLPADHKIPSSSQLQGLASPPPPAKPVEPPPHRPPEADWLNSPFQKTIAKALLFAREMGGLLTLGIQPYFPATGYGYIHQGEELAPGLYRVKQFREKPELETAQKYVESGDYLWNSGMFVWKASEFWKNYEKFLPPDALLLSSLNQDPGSSEWGKKLQEIYPRVTSISVDYAVMEKSDSVQMMKAQFEWDDVGSLKSLFKYFQQDKNGNACEGRVVTLDASGNLLMSDEGVMACLGVKDLVIIRNKDSVLVLPLDRSEEVKQILEELKKTGNTHVL